MLCAAKPAASSKIIQPVTVKSLLTGIRKSP